MPGGQPVRYALGIEYSGSAYCGWQWQPHCDSIQQRLEAAVGFVADHEVDLVCAGRTDAGVHAIEQVAHFDSRSERTARAWMMGSNCRLPADIRVLWATPVSEEFHARFSARARAYRYIVINSPVPSAVFHDRASWEFRRLDHEAMHDAAQLLVGEHDFSSFRAVGCQAKSSRRDLQEISVRRHGDLVIVDVRANAFLYHMVRNIAGSLIAVGSGQRNRAWFEEVFAARDRNLAAPTAPAGGLYFLKACYDPRYELPTTGKKPVLFDL